MEQRVMEASAGYGELDAYFQETGTRRLFLVCGKSIEKLALGAYFNTLETRRGVKVVRFSGFHPNPLYEEAARAVEAFRRSGCGAIAAVGGGSAMDVAKCVKLWGTLEPGGNYLEREAVPNEVPFLAVPTTAGTGSEATRYAVVYYRGEKQSVSHESCIPAAVLLDPGALESLPEYHRKASMLDALCHGVESFWSVLAAEESRAYSRRAIREIWAHMEGYLCNTREGNAGMLRGANLAGKAIDLAQTTGGHAMSYKLTGLYGLAHGHAAALCVGELWPYMAEKAAGTELEGVLAELAEAMGCGTVGQSVARFRDLLERLELERPEAKAGDLEVLETSVNPVRLKNNPVPLDREAIRGLYRKILWKEAQACR